MAYNFLDKNPLLLKGLKQRENTLTSHWIKAEESLGKAYNCQSEYLYVNLLLPLFLLSVVKSINFSWPSFSHL